MLFVPQFARIRKIPILASRTPINRHMKIPFGVPLQPVTRVFGWDWDRRFSHSEMCGAKEKQTMPVATKPVPQNKGSILVASACQKYDYLERPDIDAWLPDRWGKAYAAKCEALEIPPLDS
jgi:hypothetical protein